VSGGIGEFLVRSFRCLTTFFNSIPSVGSGGKQIQRQLLELKMAWLIMIPLIAIALVCAAVPLLDT
jgi:hypothetical protein